MKLRLWSEPARKNSGLRRVNYGRIAIIKSRFGLNGDGMSIKNSFLIQEVC